VTKPLPLWIVTGFLGSGKTTLIRSLIRRPELGRLAVVINEFGEIGLDHDIVEASSDDVYELVGGCLCCMVRGDLGDTLVDLSARRTIGELQQFDGVVIETSGLADPGPVLAMLLAQPPLNESYDVKAVLTVVDASNVRHDLREEAVAAAQLKAADLVVITKADLVDPRELAGLSAELKAASGGKREWVLDNGAIPADLIAALQLSRTRAVPESGAAPAAEHDFSQVRTHVVGLPTPLDQNGVDACIRVLKSLAGPALMRAKGLIILPAPARAVVLQAVRDAVYPPMPLGGSPHGHASSRMILITKNIAWKTIEPLFKAEGLAISTNDQQR